MRTSIFFVHKADIYRLTPTISGGRTIEDWQLNETNIACCVQPSAEELIGLGEGDFFNTFNIFFPEKTNVQVGDKCLIDSINYLVRGVQKRDYGITRNHVKVSALRK